MTGLTEEVRNRHGRIDVWVNNAGVRQYHAADSNERKPIVDVSVEVWDAVLNTNLRGVFLCTKAVLPSMLSRNHGRLIHISSGHGSKGRPRRAPYVASKFGLEGFHESLALELEEAEVDSIALRPPDGGVYTEVKDEHGHGKSSARHESPDVIAEAAVQIASGKGDNGGRYIATEDGNGYTTYTRT